MLPPQVEPRGDWQVGSGPVCGGLEHVLQCSEVQPLPGAPHSESPASPPSQGQRLPQGGADVAWAHRFGPKHQHKGRRSQRKGRLPLGVRAPVSLDCPASCLAPAVGPWPGASHWLLGGPLLPLAWHLASLRGWPSQSWGWQGASCPDLGLAPLRGRKQQTLYTKAKSTLGRPCSRFTGRETEAQGPRSYSPVLLGQHPLGRVLRALGCPSVYARQQCPKKKQLLQPDSRLVVLDSGSHSPARLQYQGRWGEVSG